MRLARVKIDSEEFSALYHCISRIVGGEHLLKGPDKEKLRNMLWETAEACGIEILTYIFLSNHIHIYLLVPKRVPLSDEELLRRYAILHPHPTKYQRRTLERVRSQLATNGPAAVAFRKQMHRQMNDVSTFMGTLKQRFTIWYNDHHDGRFGTLWAGRFKSGLTQEIVEITKIVGAYVDLNSVRAGLVADPKDYRFSGYAEALAGNKRAREGIMKLTGCGDWETAAARYREVIFTKGSLPSEKGRRISKAQLDEVIRQRGKLPLATLLNLRLRYFVDGLVLGTPEFVEKHLALCGKTVRPRRVHLLPFTADCGELAIPKRMRGPAVL